MVYKQDGLRILIFDAEADPAVLPIAWRVGSWLQPFDIVIAARSHDGAMSELLTKLDRVGPMRIDEIHYYCHGSTARPVIGTQPMSRNALKIACGDRIDEDTLVWIRACDVARGEDGQRWMERSVELLGCAVAAHCFVVSLSRLSFELGPWGRPEVPSIYQSGLYILLPLVPEEPGRPAVPMQAYWSADLGVGRDGRSLLSGRRKPNTVTIWAKTPPESLWREAERERTLQRKLGGLL